MTHRWHQEQSVKALGLRQTALLGHYALVVVDGLFSGNARVGPAVIADDATTA